jgi:hypothetical protein
MNGRGAPTSGLRLKKGEGGRAAADTLLAVLDDEPELAECAAFDGG